MCPAGRCRSRSGRRSGAGRSRSGTRSARPCTRSGCPRRGWIWGPTRTVLRGRGTRPGHCGWTWVVLGRSGWWLSSSSTQNCVSWLPTLLVRESWRYVGYDPSSGTELSAHGAQTCSSPWHVVRARELEREWKCFAAAKVQVNTPCRFTSFRCHCRSSARSLGHNHMLQVLIGDKRPPPSIPRHLPHLDPQRQQISGLSLHFKLRACLSRTTWVTN